jgi:hypothetical protein
LSEQCRLQAGRVLVERYADAEAPLRAVRRATAELDLSERAIAGLVLVAVEEEAERGEALRQLLQQKVHLEVGGCAAEGLLAVHRRVGRVPARHLATRAHVDRPPSIDEREPARLALQMM